MAKRRLAKLIGKKRVKKKAKVSPKKTKAPASGAQTAAASPKLAQRLKEIMQHWGTESSSE